MSTDSAHRSAGEDSDPVAELEAAEEAVERAQERIDEFGEPELERLADAHDEFAALLDRYEEPATGDGDFQTFIEFQGKVADFVERLPDDLLLREAFEEADEHLQQRRLTESDFEQVRRDLEPVADLAARLDDRQDAIRDYRKAYADVRRRLNAVQDEIANLERLQRLGQADLEAPVEELREPIETYDESVTEAFQEYRTETPAREVLEFLVDVDAFPLVPFETPPDDLADYLRNSDAGEETIPHLLEMADYSRSKLDHYVDEPDRLKRTVATQQTFFRRLDAEPLTVGWPPPARGHLAWRCRELTSVVDRFAPEVVADLRDVTALIRREDYERLQESSVAQDALSDEERERLERGGVEDDLADLRAEREQLETALDEYPDR